MTANVEASSSGVGRRRADESKWKKSCEEWRYTHVVEGIKIGRRLKDALKFEDETKKSISILLVKKHGQQQVRSDKKGWQPTMEPSAAQKW